MNRQLDGMDLSGSVVLETYVNAWFFLYTQQSHFPENGQYIIVDKYPETLSMYKNSWNRRAIPSTSCTSPTAPLQLPLVPGCVDLNIDLLLPPQRAQLLPAHLFLRRTASPSPENARILGTYFYFDGGRKSMETLLATYPKASPPQLLPALVQTQPGKMGSTLEQAENDGPSPDSGNNIGFGFHQKGEKLVPVPPTPGGGYNQETQLIVPFFFSASQPIP